MVDNTFVAFFADYSTAPGAPLTGLSATFTLVNVDNGSVIYNGQGATSLGGGFYKFVASGMSESINYAYYFNPNDNRANIESGVTGLLYKAIGDIRTSGGGVSINYANINNHTTKKIKEFRDEIIPKVEEVKNSVDEKKFDISPIVDRIDSIPEVNLTRVNESLGTIKMTLTKLSQFVRNDADKEMKEMTSEHYKKMKEMEKRFEEIENVYKELEKESVELEETAQELMEGYEEENKNAVDIALEKIKQSL